MSSVIFSPRKLGWVVLLFFASGSIGFAQDLAEAGNMPLSPGDLIQVKVFQEDDLAAVIRVANNGTVNLPLVGVLRVGGQTPQGAAETIRAALAKDYLVNPQVTVHVAEYTKRRFTILGQVQKPGEYEIPDRSALTLLQAIGMAGGYTRIADAGKVFLKRDVNGKEEVTRLNAKKMASGDVSSSVAVRPGDVITVGESIF